MKKIYQLQCLMMIFVASGNLYAKYIDPTAQSDCDCKEISIDSNLDWQVKGFEKIINAQVLSNPLGKPPTQPIQVGGSIDDACGAGGYIPYNVYLYYNPRYVAKNNTIKFGPSTYMVLGAGTQMFLCGELGAYTRVVIPNGPWNCGVGTPINPRQVYTGPCWSGWIETRLIIQTAG